MLFRQLFDAGSSTYTYLLGDPDTGRALLIDPVVGQVKRDLKLVRELGLRLTDVIETHVHADHITGAGQLRSDVGCLVHASAAGASCADRHLEAGDLVTVGGIRLLALATPGHTDDSLSFVGSGRVFTGDALLIRGCGRTDFQNGSSDELYDSITRVLFALPPQTLVYPAHDYRGCTVSTIDEEQRFNPRIAGRSRESFIALMAELNLPPPRFLEVAVPANLACGLVPSEAEI